MSKIFWAAGGIVAVIVLGGMIWVRTVGVPSDRYRLSDEMPAPGDHPEEGGFTAVRRVDDPAAAFARLVARIEATPRTRRLDGGGAGQASFVTRSAVWGFPDVTNVRVDGGRIEIRGHLVIGRGDMGVNRRRLERWLSEAGFDATA